MLLPREADRRMLAVATWTALLAPVLMALALRTRLATLWTLPMWSMLPALLLSARSLQTTRSAAAGVLAAALAFPLIAILLCAGHRGLSSIATACPIMRRITG